MAAHYTVRARLAAWVLISIEWIISRLPLRWAIGLGGAIGWVAGPLRPPRSRVVDENLARAFPEMSPCGRRRLRRRFFVHFGRWIFENFHSGRLDAAARDPFVAEEGRENRDLAVGDGEGGGIIVVTAHLGSWELMGMHFAREGFAISAVAQPLHNGHLNDHVARVRERGGLRIIFTKTEMTPVITERLAKGEVVGFLADVDSRQFGTFVEFFGQLASTPRGPAMYALRTGRPILPVFTVRERGTEHRLIYGEPIRPPRDVEDFDRAVRDITQAFTRQLEAVIRRFPEQYFWVHRRWKTRPEDIKPKRRRRAGLDL